jgi:ribosomal protein L37AE/L43A
VTEKENPYGARAVRQGSGANTGPQQHHLCPQCSKKAVMHPSGTPTPICYECRLENEKEEQKREQ